MGKQIGQQQMRYSEQQINYSLQCLEEQEELDAYCFQASRNNQIILQQRGKREIDISDWRMSDQHQSTRKKKRKFPYLKDSSIQKDKGYMNFADLLSESHQNTFAKYEKLPPYRIDKPKEQRPVPKKIDLKLPLPSFNNEDRTRYLSQTALPQIKKIVLPVKLLRMDRTKLTSEELQMQDLADLAGLGGQMGELAKKSSLLASYRRQLRSFHSFTQRNPKTSLDNNKLKECITFIK